MSQTSRVPKSGAAARSTGKSTTFQLQVDDPIVAAQAEEQTFIVRNTLPGHHCVTDIGLTFGPFQVRDLTWEDKSIVKRSQDLRNSLRKGLLEQITQAQWDVIEDKAADRERVQLLKELQKREHTQFLIDTGQIEGELKDYSQRGVDLSDELSTAGYANDPVSYAMAYQREKAVYAQRGEDLDSADFAEMVMANNGKLENLRPLRQGVVSGDPGRGRATVLMPPTEEGQAYGPTKFNMTNYNRDHRIAGSTSRGMMNMANPNDGLNFAEEINIGDEAPTTRRR